MLAFYAGIIMYEQTEACDLVAVHTHLGFTLIPAIDTVTVLVVLVPFFGQDKM